MNIWSNTQVLCSSLPDIDFSQWIDNVKTTKPVTTTNSNGGKDVKKETAKITTTKTITTTTTASTIMNKEKEANKKSKN